MPVSMSGMASGMDTESIINNLDEIERRPIQQLEIDKNKYRNRKEALKQLQGVLEEIDKNAKNLFGFRASFDDKKALSSDTSIIEATATKKAKEGSTALKIVKTATNHKVSSDPVKNDEKLPPLHSLSLSTANGDREVSRAAGCRPEGEDRGGPRHAQRLGGKKNRGL